MAERKVHVWGKSHTITVEQESKAKSIASGEYMGQSIQVKDRTANAATKRWVEAARYKGN